MSISKLPRYCLDTSVVSLLLNGELWRRAPFNLMKARPSLAPIVMNYGMKSVEMHDYEVDRSTKAYQWSLLHSKEVQLLATPTACFELTRAIQVSTGLCFIVTARCH